MPLYRSPSGVGPLKARAGRGDTPIEVLSVCSQHGCPCQSQLFHPPYRIINSSGLPLRRLRLRCFQLKYRYAVTQRCKFSPLTMLGLVPQSQNIAEASFIRATRKSGTGGCAGCSVGSTARTLRSGRRFQRSFNILRPSSIIFRPESLVS